MIWNCWFGLYNRFSLCY